MFDQRNKKNFWVMCFVLIPLYFLIQYFSPQLIHHFYHTEAIHTLNAITGAEIDQPLDFYIGRMNDIVFLPIASVISGIVFLVFCLTFLRGVDTKKFACAVFAFLLIFKWEVLFFPPYGETVAGPFSEALWLYHHSFDYVGLFHQQSFTWGGPKVYLFSLYPTYLAVLFKILPSVKVFIIVNHLIVFILSAVIISLFRAVLLKKYNDEVATLTSIVFLSLPVVQSMIEAINMEIPCLFFVMLSAYYLIHYKIMRASIMAIIAALVKGPGGLACASVFIITVLLLIFDKEFKGKYKILIWPTIALGVGFAKVLLLRLFINPGVQPPAGTISVFAGWGILSSYSRHLIISYVITLAFFLIIYIKDWMKHKSERNTLFRKYYEPIVFFIFAGMWFGVYLNVSTMGPRYQLLLVPFLLCCVLFIFSSWIKSQRITVTILVFLIVLSNLCAFGLFHKEKVESSMWSYNDFERSLEYRNDLKMHQRLAGEIEQYYSDYTIGAPFVVAQKLAFPELGYVTKKMDVMVYGMELTYMRSFTQLKDINIIRTVWTGFYKSDLPDGLVYPIDPQDRFLRDIVMGDKKIALFQGGFAIERARIFFEMYKRGILQLFSKKK